MMQIFRRRKIKQLFRLFELQLGNPFLITCLPCVSISISFPFKVEKIIRFLDLSKIQAFHYF